MTSFIYNTTVPNAPDNPSFDQPIMQVNTQSINGIIGVDHVTFNSTGSGGPGSSGGQHLQVTFNGKNIPGGMPTDPLSIMYTNSGVASTVSQVFYSNQNGIFQLSALRAWAYSDNTGAIIGGQSVNVASITPGGVGVYNVVLTANAVSTDNFAVFISVNAVGAGNILVPNYSITGIGTFTITFLRVPSATANPTNFTFQVLQI